MNQYQAVKQQIVDASQHLLEKGYLMATGGNISIRVPSQVAFAVTPSNYDCAKMGAAYMSQGLVMLAGSRMYTSLAHKADIIGEALNRFETVLSSVEGVRA